MRFTEFLQEANKPKSVDDVHAMYMKHETDDFQNRGGNYPKSGVPDAISAGTHGNDTWLEFSFKNTSEAAAKSWVKKFMASKNLPHVDIASAQDGDYHDDWVLVDAKYTA